LKKKNINGSNIQEQKNLQFKDGQNGVVLKLTEAMFITFIKYYSMNQEIELNKIMDNTNKMILLMHFNYTLIIHLKFMLELNNIT